MAANRRRLPLNGVPCGIMAIAMSKSVLVFLARRRLAFSETVVFGSQRGSNIEQCRVRTLTGTGGFVLRLGVPVACRFVHLGLRVATGAAGGGAATGKCHDKDHAERGLQHR